VVLGEKTAIWLLEYGRHKAATVRRKKEIRPAVRVSTLYTAAGGRIYPTLLPKTAQSEVSPDTCLY